MMFHCVSVRVWYDVHVIGKQRVLSRASHEQHSRSCDVCVCRDDDII